MIQNPCNLSDSDLREWAYNDDIELMEQDEDLLLHDVKYMPVLLACVRDQDCPKSGYIFGIIAHFGQLRLLHRLSDEATALCREILRQQLLSGGERLSELKYLISACNQLVAPRSLLQGEADELAFDLLIRQTARTLTATGRTIDGYREYTYSSPYQHYLYVAPEKGTWVYSKLGPLRKVP